MTTNKINMGESLLFLLSCREALAGIVESSSMLPAEKGRSKDFLFNEATDYQIMSLIVRGDLPESKYNIFDESLLFQELRDQIFLSSEFLHEQFGDEILANVLFEIGPLFQNYSSAVPIVEFLTNSKGKLVVQEDALGAAGAAAEKINAVWSAFKNIPVVKAVAADLKMDPNNMKRGSEIDKMIVAQLNKAKGNVADAVQGMKDKVSKGWLQSKLERLNKGRGSRYRAPEGWWNNLQNQIKMKSMDAKAAVNNAIGQAKQYAAQNPGQADAAKVIAGAALAALAIYGAYKTYKRFFSKAAKACKGSQERKTCLKQYKVKAIQAQISDLKAASSNCAATKDPGKCQSTIGNKIQKLQTKAQKAAA